MILFSLGAVAHARRGPRSSYRVDPTTWTPRPGADGLPYLAVVVGFCLLIIECRHLSFLPVGGLVLAAGIRTALVMMRQMNARREKERLLGQCRVPARTDDLTGLHNRRYFFEPAEAVFAAAHRIDRPLIMLMIDIDDFKMINDRFERQTGDQILQSVADVCRTRLRPQDLVGRYSGDEFVLLLPTGQANSCQIDRFNRPAMTTRL